MKDPEELGEGGRRGGGRFNVRQNWGKGRRVPLIRNLAEGGVVGDLTRRFGKWEKGF